MRQAILYIAMSLDGYIADMHGGVGWLPAVEDAPAADSYDAFVRSVDTVVMGWNTYRQLVTELSPGTWVYADLTSYVITHRSCDDREGIRFTDSSPCELLRALRMEKGRDIWICGGASLAQQLMKENLIDVYRVSVIPVILGNGIRLFGELEQSIPLCPLAAENRGGFTELIYARSPHK